MRNKFPGVCYRCGNVVAAGAGHFERMTAKHRVKWPNMTAAADNWLTQHTDCAIKFRGTRRHYIYAPNIPPNSEKV